MGYPAQNNLAKGFLKMFINGTANVNVDNIIIIKPNGG